MPEMIDVDLWCEQCGYNLRGLPVTGACPECGLSCVDTVGQKLETHPLDETLRLLRATAEFTGIADEARSMVSGVQFVLHAAANRIGRVAAGGTRVSMIDIVNGVRDLAVSYFNDRDEAIELLAEWSVASSDDIVRIIRALVIDGKFLQGTPADVAGSIDPPFEIRAWLSEVDWPVSEFLPDPPSSFEPDSFRRRFGL